MKTKYLLERLVANHFTEEEWDRLLIAVQCRIESGIDQIVLNPKDQAEKELLRRWKLMRRKIQVLRNHRRRS